MKKLIISAVLLAMALTSCTEQKKQITVSSVVYGVEFAYTTEDIKIGDTVKIGYNLRGEKIASADTKTNSIGHISKVTKN